MNDLINSEQLKRKPTVNAVAGFVQHFLLDKYDSPVPIPAFHRDMWEISLSDNNHIAFAAPRGFAKSTAITHTIVLVSILYKLSRYTLIISDTEGQAIQFLGSIAEEFRSNEAMCEAYGFKVLKKDSATEIIGQFRTGEMFCIRAFGTGQKVRGRKWGNYRPDLIICDDLENDEMMENDQTREKARLWFLNALVPSLAKHGRIIVVGTILHLDSLLMRLMDNSEWTTKCYRAHKAFDDFSDLLWPEQHSEESLRKIRQGYINEGYAEGYSQEYLNDPIAQSEAYFRKEDFIEMEDSDFDKMKTYYAAVDFAISDKDKAAYTVIVVGGLDPEGFLNIEHVIRFRGDQNQIIEVMFEVQRHYDIDTWFPEKGQIWLGMEGEFYVRMQRSGIYLNFDPQVPIADKRGRARPIQARMRAGGVKFNKNAGWYPAFEQEHLQFPKGRYKDQVDAMAWLGIAIAKLVEGPTRAEYEEAEYQERQQDSFRIGADFLTGY